MRGDEKTYVSRYLLLKGSLSFRLLALGIEVTIFLLEVLPQAKEELSRGLPLAEGNGDFGGELDSFDGDEETIGSRAGVGNTREGRRRREIVRDGSFLVVHLRGEERKREEGGAAG